MSTHLSWKELFFFPTISAKTWISASSKTLFFFSLTEHTRQCSQPGVSVPGRAEQNTCLRRRADFFSLTALRHVPCCWSWAEWPQWQHRGLFWNYFESLHFWELEASGDLPYSCRVLRAALMETSRTAWPQVLRTPTLWVIWKLPSSPWLLLSLANHSFFLRTRL